MSSSRCLISTRVSRSSEPRASPTHVGGGFGHETPHAGHDNTGKLELAVDPLEATHANIILWLSQGSINLLRIFCLFVGGGGGAMLFGPALDSHTWQNQGEFPSACTGHLWQVIF